MAASLRAWASLMRYSFLSVCHFQHDFLVQMFRFEQKFIHEVKQNVDISTGGIQKFLTSHNGRFSFFQVAFYHRL